MQPPLPLCALAIGLLTTLTPAPLRADAGVSADTKTALQAQSDRAGVIYLRGKQAHYTKKFDLSGMPHYVPHRKLTGWIRFHGNNYLADGMLADYWQKGFEKYQPGIRLSYFLPTSAVAFGAMYYHQADITMDHEPGFYDLLAYERVMNSDPLTITAVTGSFDVGGWSNSIAIIVNASNPIKGLSVKQLDGIFGAARDGGWIGTAWHPDFARGPEENIRTWGQLGLSGEWADKRIGVYGFALRYNTSTNFSDKVLHGSDKWNEDIHTYGNWVKPDGTRLIEADQIAMSVAKDRYGIGYILYRGDRPGIRRLPLAAQDGQPYVEHTIDNVQNMSYPMINQLYFYVPIQPGDKLDPKVKEFIRYVLSQEGQEAVERDGKYLPLTAEVVREQLKKLD